MYKAMSFEEFTAKGLDRQTMREKGYSDAINGKCDRDLINEDLYIAGHTDAQKAGESIEANKC